MATPISGLPVYRPAGLAGIVYTTLAILVGASISVTASPRHGGAPIQSHRPWADHVRLQPCPVADLDCRAFTGTLGWQPDERRPLLSSRGLRRLVLLRGLNAAHRERALRCLAVIAWLEARSDGIAGMWAVAAVVLNRTRSAAFPDHPCDVLVQQSAFEPLASRANYRLAAALRRGQMVPFPRPASAVDADALHQAQLLVWNLAQAPELTDPTGGATHFLAPDVLTARGQDLPRWAELYESTASIGGHRFYRAPVRLGP